MLRAGPGMDSEWSAASTCSPTSLINVVQVRPDSLISYLLPWRGWRALADIDNSMDGLLADLI